MICYNSHRIIKYISLVTALDLGFVVFVFT